MIIAEKKDSTVVTKSNLIIVRKYLHKNQYWQLKFKII